MTNVLAHMLLQRANRANASYLDAPRYYALALREKYCALALRTNTSCAHIGLNFFLETFSFCSQFLNFFKECIAILRYIQKVISRLKEKLSFFISMVILFFFLIWSDFGDKMYVIYRVQISAERWAHQGRSVQVWNECNENNHIY